MNRLFTLLVLVGLPSLAFFAHADNSPIIWQGANSKDLTSGGLVTPRLSLPENLTGTDKVQIVAPASVTGNTTLTTPDTTDTLAGIAATQTLTNKTINADSNTLTNIENADIKAAAAIDGSKISPSFGAQNVNTTALYQLDGSTFIDNAGTDNTWVGLTGNTAITTGQRNTLFGRFAGNALVDGNNNSYTGYASGLNAVSTVGNACFGYESCRAVTASSVVGMGLQALYTGAGTDSTGIGRSSLYAADATSLGSTGIGRNALVNVSTGDYNLGLGYASCGTLDTGSGTTCVGADTTAGATVSAGFALGRGAGVTVSNTLVAGSETYPLATWTVGEGETTTTPSTTTIRASGASGTNTAGGDLNLGAGRATGNAATGVINMQVATAGASGTTLQTLGTVGTFGTYGMALPNELAARYYEATGGGSNYVAVKSPAALSGDFTLTLPAATDTLVGKATTDTLTNKTLTSPVLTTPILNGVTDASNAGTGVYGQVETAQVIRSAANSLVTNVAENITSITLTDGDWDIRAILCFTLVGATSSAMSSSLSLTSATVASLDDTAVGVVPIRMEENRTTTTLTGDTCVVTPPTRYNYTGASDTVYLVARSTFTAGTVAGFGSITARRVR